MGRLNAQIDRLAAEWAARVADGDLTPEERASFESWLAADIRHLGAYARVEAGLVRLERLRAVGADSLRATAPALAPAWTRRRMLLTGTTAACLAAASVVGAIVWTDYPQQAFATRIGETRVIPLPDGSVVTLNTNSSMSVNFNESVRRIRLEKGEAFFRVAKNKARPFIVDALNTEVRAVGTSFTVRALPQRPVQILVQEGVVEVTRTDTSKAAAVRAVAETQTLVPVAAPIVTRAVPPPQVARNLAWRFGRIALENETLEDAAEEFARYSNTRIVVDPAVANRTVTGRFASNDPVGFAKAAASVLNLHVEVESTEVRINP
jgi:transmembrane sensor